MSYTSLPTVVQDDPIDVDYLNQIKTDLDDHEARLANLGSMEIANGSFETVDGSGYPISWTWTGQTGGTRGSETTAPGHGTRGIWITSPGGSGNGGGTYTSDYAICDDRAAVCLFVLHKASVAGMRNIIRIRWYDKAKSYLSSATIYDEASLNPTSWEGLLFTVNPVASARYFKIELVGGDSSDTTAGTAYFDGIRRLDLVPRDQVGTVAEQTLTGSGGWATKASVYTYIPPSVSRIRIKGQVRVSVNDDEATVRWKLGSVYGNEAQGNPPNSTTYVPVTNYLDVSSGQGTVAALELQMNHLNGSRTAYYKRDAADQAANDFVL